MKMIAKLTRPQLDGLVFVCVLVVLSVISSVFNVAAGVDRNRSAMAPNQVTTSAPEAGTISVKESACGQEWRHALRVRTDPVGDVAPQRLHDADRVGIAGR